MSSPDSSIPKRPTGPRTPEGKARSSMNALKEGFRSAHIIVPEGSEPAFQELLDQLYRAFQPQTDNPAEEFFFERLVKDAWNIERIEKKMAEIYEKTGHDPLAEDWNSDQSDRLERIKARTEGSFRANIRELRNLQSNRVLQEMLPEPLGPGTLPRLAKPNTILHFAKRTLKGFEDLSIKCVVHRANKPETKPRGQV